MSSGLAHLSTRFFDVLFSKPLTDGEASQVSAWVEPQLAAVFFEQSDADQRHGYHAATYMIEHGFAGRPEVAAALLHDIGKRHADLGVVGRTVASVLIALGLPLTKRMKAYRDHGVVGSHELARLGAPSVVVEFAAQHHGTRPQGFSPESWEALIASDQPPNPRALMRSRITSPSE